MTLPKSHANDEKDVDVNGYWNLKGVPISKVGVFPYKGSTIDGAPDPNAIYNVLRPEEEISSEDTINSFKLMPWIDDHAMLGCEDEDLTPPEKKGIHGVLGEDVFYKDGILYSNAKIHSDALKRKIKNGKVELSLGYRCRYDHEPGVWNGIPYEYVQRNIRGNHIASVDKARMGGDIRVMDEADFFSNPRFMFTCDSSFLEKKMEGKNEMNDPNVTTGSSAVTLEQVVAKLNDLAADVAALKKSQSSAESQGKEGQESAKDAIPSQEEKNLVTVDPDRNEDEDEDDHDIFGEILDMISDLDSRLSKIEGTGNSGEQKSSIVANTSAMDEAIGKHVEEKLHAARKMLLEKVDLANRVSRVVGAFDHSDMATASDVAKYGCTSLGLKPLPGQEISMIEGYLASLAVPASSITSQTRADWLQSQLNK